MYLSLEKTRISDSYIKLGIIYYHSKKPTLNFFRKTFHHRNFFLIKEHQVI